ncbi:MAG TPA: ABC transporter ATP-binding protein [Verrucomicrobium sp.]|nr:ABC transporter ATP-binding protein [Verrucomicrobium sp.]
MSLLHLANLSKTYPRTDRPAVKNACLQMQSGELLALVGESGSGKTTLLRLIAGLETADTGKITVGDLTVTDGRKKVDAEHRGVGLVFQHHALFPHLTIAANICFGIRRLPRAEQKRRTEDLLTLVGLPGYERRYPHELSGGERQRIALVRALAPEPRLLLLDEPFSNLDPQWRVEIRDETRRILKQRGTSALLVTHHTQDALSVADRIAVLHQGEMQQVGTPNEIYHAPANRYVATLFGVCNFIPMADLARPCGTKIGCDIGPSPSAGQGLWVRPEDLELAPSKEAPGTVLTGTVLTGTVLTGMVRTVSFQGDHYDVMLDCTIPGTSPFEVRVQHRGPENVSAGESWAVLPRPRGQTGAMAA